ncbi:formylglycine-generating enzyme family protein [bacterium]|nr:formylglycine-generating enzyme family protein [bacterium]
MKQVNIILTIVLSLCLLNLNGCSRQVAESFVAIYDVINPELWNGIRVEMAIIPSGTYTDVAGNTVSVNEFLLSKYEITIEEWILVRDSYNSVPIPDGFCRPSFGPITFDTHGDDPNMPVYGVTWEDVDLFLDFVNGPRESDEKPLFRLPTEEEWEYACRAGTQTPFYCGTDLTDRFAVFDRRDEGVNPVGSKIPNDFGLYDMHGNVLEWTSSPSITYSDEYILRGGSFSNRARECSSFYRNEAPPYDHSDYIDPGFRLVLGE